MQRKKEHDQRKQREKLVLYSPSLQRRFYFFVPWRLCDTYVPTYVLAENRRYKERYHFAKGRRKEEAWENEKVFRFLVSG